MILSGENKFEFEIRNIGGSDVYYKRNIGDKLWLFSTKEEFELNKNIMDKKYSESAIEKGAEIEMEHKKTIENFMKNGTNVKDVVKAIAIDHLEENPLSYSDYKGVCMNESLMIRLFELMNEDIKSDVDLHKVAEKVISASKNKDILTMDDYESFLLNTPKEESYSIGGGVEQKENSNKIECHNPNCNWSWSVESGGDDLYVCHKCNTDNEKFYEKGGSLENDFEIEENEDGDRITISLKGIGEVILVQTSPEYEFTEDIDEDTLEELNVSDGDMIGKIEHLEVNDKFKGKGYAKSLMNKAIEIAEEYGWMPLYLNASPMGSKRYGLNIEDLTGFYETFGFKVFLEQGNNNLMLLNEKENFSKGGLIAPNGKPSNLTPKQYKLVRKPEFKAWFGDWENDPANASKVVDRNGEPLVVWHGSKYKFNTFKKNKVNFNYKQSIGFHFSDLKERALIYSNGGFIYEVFLNIRNPLLANSDFTGKFPINRDLGEEAEEYIDNNRIKLKKEVIEGNYDGIMAKGFSYTKSFVAFEPNQIKLADGTNTTFDSNNPDIRFEDGGEVEDLISQGIVELKMLDTKPEHAKEYGLDSINPLYVQSLNVNENKRLKGVGKKVLQYIDDYAIKNGHDVVFGNITQNATMKKDNRTGYFTEFTDIDFIKHWLFRNGYSVNQENNDFHKVVMSDSNDINNRSNPNIRFYDGGDVSKNVDNKLKELGFEFNKFNYRYGKTINEQDYITAFYSKKENLYKIRGTHKFTTPLGENSVGIQFDFNNEKEFYNKIQEYLSKSINDSDVSFEDGGKIQLNSNKGKVNLKLSSYEDVTELVPVSELLKLREFNRYERPKYSLDDSKDNISKLEDELVNNGVEEPLIIEYSLADNSVLLIEGNHRLNVAENLGFDYLPARVVLRRREFSPLQKTKAFKVKGFTPDKYGYVPSDLKPSQVGIGGTTKAFEDGGIVEGQLHSECNEETGCGEKYDVGGVGHIIEVERDEAVIVSKAFQDNSKYEIKGTLSEIASALNVLGDGKNFDSGAEIKSEDGKKVEVAEIKKEAKNTDVETIDPNSIIINRRSMYDKEEYVAKGTPKEIASQINNLNDNGVKIVDGGSIKKA